jgi:hypothetical protein
LSKVILADLIDPDVSLKDAVKLKLLSILVESTKLPSLPLSGKKVIKKEKKKKKKESKRLPYNSPRGYNSTQKLITKKKKKPCFTRLTTTMKKLCSNFKICKLNER